MKLSVIHMSPGPRDPGEAHKTAWTLLHGNQTVPRRNFLFRVDPAGDGNARMTILSPSPPPNPPPRGRLKGVHDLHVPKRSERLDYRLRANAVSGAPSKRSGVASRAYRKAVAAGAGREAALDAARAALGEWLFRQGRKAGFRPLDFRAAVSLVRFTYRGLAITLEIADLAGTLEVIDPDLLRRRIPQGFGRAKGFGFGLMLLRDPGLPGENPCPR